MSLTSEETDKGLIKTLAGAVSHARLIRWDYHTTLDAGSAARWMAREEESENLLQDIEVVLGILADAGMLFPPGGETRTDYGCRIKQMAVNLPQGYEEIVSMGSSKFAQKYGTHKRTIVTWPEEQGPNDGWARYTGPWVKVEK